MALFKHLIPKPFRKTTPVVPLIRLGGVIGARSMLQSGLSLAGVEKAIKEAFDVKEAVAVALAINSPGGSPVQAHLIYRRIRALAEEKKLPVIAYLEDVAASGGYMLACAGDEIVADPSSIVGSIGVVSSGFGLDRAIGKLGIDRRVYTAGSRKATLDPFQPENIEDIDHLKDLQREVHTMFIDLVKARRGDKLTGDEADLFSGLFWAGGSALGLGLVDRLGNLHEDIREKFGEKAEIRLMGREKGFLRRRLFGSATPRLPASLLSGEELLSAIESRLHFSRYGL
ncbi:S49 family peptidase [Oryzibacter oryziterrae]|uniref:S49 family peptidase n=1 Tax=Oryzibacter oryziterrae TaxID=2766474 RepID=UPI001F35BE83|nr:S49 family peptidase [Oryzibacter oryziterrae]